MKCLRCGKCCRDYAVVVVKNPDIGISLDNMHAVPIDGPCPHLRGDKPGNYFCAVHDRPWYPETPCAAHSQIGRPEAPCRVGDVIMRMEAEGGPEAAARKYLASLGVLWPGEEPLK